MEIQRNTNVDYLYDKLQVIVSICFVFKNFYTETVFCCKLEKNEILPFEKEFIKIIAALLDG